MILLNCKDEFLSRHIKSLLKQKNFLVTSRASVKFFAEIDLKKTSPNIKILFKSKECSLRAPLRFNEFFSNLEELIKDIIIDLKQFSYKPFAQEVFLDNESCYLGNIHNLIFSNLLLNLNSGINKFDLYKEIWPLDKEVQINKLETHLTNLKTKIKTKLNINLNISSNEGKINLRIN